MRFVSSITTTVMKGYFLCDKCHARSPRVRHEYIDEFPQKGVVPPTKEQSVRTHDLVEELAREECGIYVEYDWGEDPIGEEDFATVLN